MIRRAADSNVPSPPPAQRDSGGEGRVMGGKLLSAARLTRRNFVCRSALAALVAALAGPKRLVLGEESGTVKIPIVDTHQHLWDFIDKEAQGFCQMLIRFQPKQTEYYEI